jgi:hypothetical protein
MTIDYSNSEYHREIVLGEIVLALIDSEKENNDPSTDLDFSENRIDAIGDLEEVRRAIPIEPDDDDDEGYVVCDVVEIQQDGYLVKCQDSRSRWYGKTFQCSGKRVLDDGTTILDRCKEID